VTRWATEAARYGKPLYLRFAHEMNDPYRYPWGPQNGNRPDDFIAAWKHVHLIFQKMNAANVLWVWSPHISMPWFEYYYPGDEWVDWIGTGVLNYGDVAPWSRWWTFHQILEKAYPALVKLRKPIMITEFGSVASGGDAAQWYGQAFRDVHEKYGAIRSVIFFNQTRDATLSTTPLNWSPLQDARTARVVAEAMRREAKVAAR
jgi:beta-mannanase